MNEFRYKRIFFSQIIFLTLLSIVTFIFFKNNASVFNYFLLWTVAIILNLYTIKFFALPSVSEIEETITKKDVALNQQKKEYELENLKYKRLLDSLQDPVCILTRNLIIIYANEAFRNLFSYTEKKFPAPLIRVTRNLDFQKFLEEAVETNQTATKSYFSFNQLQDPHKTYFDLKVFSVENEINFLCLLHDVTERKMTDQVREDFVSNFSHEVRTPLTILNGQMQNLKAQLIKEPNFESRFGDTFLKIENNSRRLINLFNDLLRLTSVETKKDINKEPINIEEMLTFLAQDLMINYPKKKITVNIDLAQKIFLVDYNLFEQALLNLIDNALKYTRENGHISISSFHQDDWDHLIIKDSGMGIPEDQLHRIFERFFRVDASRSSDTEGTGLGLSIVKHIVQKHDGRIKVQSKSKEGTTFTLSFPSK
ncbi:MAG: ATP-binding protein [Bacteriovorax sp.]|jgi:two-component system phosphate regulon sensor histidine kinase PhoR